MLDEAGRRRALRKLDLLLIPILTITYGLQFYDKAILGSASVFGVIEDLDLSTPVPGSTTVSTLRYSTATAAFYWGYIIAVLPFSLLLQRLPLGKSTAAFVFLWGALVLVTLACKDYPGLVVQRVFLGATESVVSPAFVAISTMFYTKGEISSRIGYWYSATGIFSMFSGVVNYGLGNANSSSLSSWKILFLFGGLLTVVWSAVIFWFVPDTISGARYFSVDEKQFLSDRLIGQTQGAADKRIRSTQLWEALRDPLVYVYLIIGSLIYICNGGVTAFGARIIRTFGYTSLQSILLQIPGGAATCIAIYIFCWIDGKYKNITTILLPLSCVPVMIGSIILWKGSWQHRGLPLFGYWLIPTFGAPFVLLLSLASRNTSGGAKKAVVNGATFIGYCVGNIIGPYTVLTPEATRKYRTTWITLISAMSVTVALSLLLRVYYTYENKRRDRLFGDSKEFNLDAADPNANDKESGAREEKLDADLHLSDRQNKNFRYSL